MWWKNVCSACPLEIKSLPPLYKMLISATHHSEPGEEILITLFSELSFFIIILSP